MTPDIDQICAETDHVVEKLDQMLSAEEAQRAKQTEANKVNDAVTQNPKTKSKNRAANMAALQQLMEAYPAVFSRDNVRPLKIGIQEDLVADDKLAKNKIKRALASYVRSPQYYRSIREGVDRIGIDGAASGQVTEQEAQYAKEKLKEINQNRRQKQREVQKAKEKEERFSRKLEALVTRK